MVPDHGSRTDNRSKDDERGDDADRPNHLDDVPDGCGCVEVWEVLSERRERSEE